MHVDHRADEANDKLVIQSDYKTMARVGKKFLRGWLHNGIIEHILGHLVKNVKITLLQKLYFSHIPAFDLYSFQLLFP